MTIKHFFFAIVLLALCLAATSCDKDTDITPDNPNKVMKRATITRFDGKGIPNDTTRAEFTYDDQKRITTIQINKIDGKGKATPYMAADYTYNTDNLVSKARMSGGNAFTDAVFTYNDDKEIVKVVYGGQWSGTVIDVTYTNKGYIFSGSITTQMSYLTHQVSKFQTKNVEFTYRYEESIKNGSANLGAQIGIPSFFLFFPVGELSLLLPYIFPNIFNAGVIKEMEISFGTLIKFTNEKDNLGFVTKTKYINLEFNEISYEAVYTYQ